MTEQFQPVFNFEGNLTPEDEINKMMEEAESQSQGNSIFRPGTHNLVVTGVELKGPTKGDSAWMKVLIRFAGVDKLSGKKISTLVLVPTTGRLTYEKEGGDATIYPFKNLVDTLAGLGVTLTRDNVSSAIPQYFAPQNLNALVGRTATAEIGFRGAHAQGVKSEDGSRLVKIVNYGEDLKDDTGTVLMFKGDDAYDQAEAYCKKAGITYAAFPDILSFETSSSESEGGW